MRTDSTFAAFALAMSLAAFSSCQNGQGTKPTASQAEVDSLRQRITVLEEENAVQGEQIKDLEEDLEDVIRFLNNELNY